MLTCAAAGPVLAQAQYPPVTGGGPSNQATDPGTGNPFNPTTGSGTTSTTTPFCDLAHCLLFTGEVGDTFVVNKVEELGDFRVAAVSGCCERGARVDVYMESERVYLGTVFAAEDGSYQGTFKLPASIKAGTHHVIADIQGCGELRRAIEVLGAAETIGSNPGGSDPGATVPDGSSPAGVSAPDGTSPTTVLGTNFRNTADGGAGILPLTGGDLLRLLLWGVVLVLLGTVLLTARKRGLRYVWLRARGHRPIRPSEVLALPPPEVPFIDTSRFVPYRSRVREREASHDGASGTTMAGWDAPRNDSLS